MEGYASEQEQVEQLRQWWRKNGKSVIVGLLLGATVLFGVRYFLGSQDAQRLTASAVYDNLLDSLERNETAAVLERGGTILSQFSATPYAPLAALAMAKVKYEENDKTSAQTYLRWVLDNAKDDGLKHVARLRLARLHLDEGQPDAALQLVTGVEAGAFSASYDELRGDVYLAKQQPQEARRAYEAALAAREAVGDRGNLQMKLDDLGPVAAP